MTYIGSEIIISPLGITAGENWSALCANRTGIALVEGAGFNKENVFLAKIPDLQAGDRFQELVIRAFEGIRNQIDDEIFQSDRTIVILSSTKGSLDVNVTDQFGDTVAAIVSKFRLSNTPIVVSNACISGVLAINAAASFINGRMYDHAVVIGCDIVSDFVIYGFQSLFAMSDKPCAPFDIARNGISLGEGCGAVVVSRDRSIFKTDPYQLLAGVSANDANHISGPSRTGEGLLRSISKTLEMNHVRADEIDFVSAHGTATVFNDEMESIAFDRAGLSETPMNSMKGYFGHTLGAAGVIETATCMQMMRNRTLLKSLGFRESGTSKALRVVTENKEKDLHTILKTASGFGGGNASLMIRSL